MGLLIDYSIPVTYLPHYLITVTHLLSDRERIPLDFLLQNYLGSSY